MSSLPHDIEGCDALIFRHMSNIEKLLAHRYRLLLKGMRRKALITPREKKVLLLRGYDAVDC